MKKWYFIPKYLPTDGQTVWIRLNSNAYQVFQAIYNTTAETFTSVENSIVYPVTYVWKWRQL